MEEELQHAVSVFRRESRPRHERQALLFAAAAGFGAYLLNAGESLFSSTEIQTLRSDMDRRERDQNRFITSSINNITHQLSLNNQVLARTLKHIGYFQKEYMQR